MLRTYQKLFDLLNRQQRRRFVQLLAMILVMGIIEVLGVASILPFLAVLSRPEMVQENGYLAAAYSAGRFAGPDTFMIALGAGVFCLMVFNLTFRTITFYALTRFAQMCSYTLATRLFSGYLEQPYAWYLNRHTADLAKTILGEVDRVVTGAMLPGLRLIANSVVVTLLVGMILAVNPMVALAAAGTLGGSYTIIYVVVRRFLLKIGADSVSANRERYQIVQESLGGVKEVKVLALEDRYIHRFRDPAARLARARTWKLVIADVPRNVLEVILFGGMMLLLLGMMVARAGEIGDVLPVIGLYAFAGARLVPAMQRLYFDLTSLRFHGPALQTLHADLMGCAEVGERAVHPEFPGEPLGLRDKLELRNVSYKYPSAEKPTLDGLNITVKARTTVGLVGGTGAGKTTIVDIILGLLVPQAGTILIDGIGIDQRGIPAWQRSIGYIPQQIFLTDDTVAGNIAFGVPADEIDQQAVERAARTAELHQFVIQDMPAGYETMVGERGVRLSGGQRQRIGIARALYHDPEVLILDEATSALDNLTEAVVMDAVRKLSHSKTIIIVAHRLSTIRACDQILMIAGGRVTSEGTYTQLLETSPEFQNMAAPNVRELAVSISASE